MVINHKDAIAQRFAPLALPRDHVDILHRLAESDAVRLGLRPEIADIIPMVIRLLDGGEDHVKGFYQAWLLMYGAIQRLDHLQDGDLDNDDLLKDSSPHTRYNIILTYYTVATGLLDDIAGDPAQIKLLRRFWTDCMVRMAVGQQRDLTIMDTLPTISFDLYQTIVQEKTGSTFALAFAGPALLLTSDTHTFDALVVVGEIYGTLLQFRDDISDAEDQQYASLTLPHILATTQPVALANNATLEAFWGFLYPVYLDAVAAALAGQSPTLREGVLNFFTQVFSS